MRMEVIKDVLLPAPGDHYACEASGLSYASTCGTDMIMSVRTTLGFGGSSNYRNWTSTHQRMISVDNGKSWNASGPQINCNTLDSEYYEFPRSYFLDEEKNLLIAFHFVSHAPKNKNEIKGFYGNKHIFNYYEISNDGGQTWTPPQQVICEGGDKMHPMKGLELGNTNPIVAGPFRRLDDGTLLCGLTLYHAEGPMEVAFIRGQWNNNCSQLIWDASSTITAPLSTSVAGVCEPDIAYLGGHRVVTTMRCQGNKEKNLFSTRQVSVSEDGGKTWSPPEAMKYDDGSDVYVPAAFARFVEIPDTGKVYWFANILDKPVHGQLPRYPLTIAEFDMKNLCIIKDSVTIIQGLPEDAPASDEDKGELGRRYSNFVEYIDRETGEIVLIMAEMPKISWDDFTSDTIRFRIKIDQ